MVMVSTSDETSCKVESNQIVPKITLTTDEEIVLMEGSDKVYVNVSTNLPPLYHCDILSHTTVTPEDGDECIIKIDVEVSNGNEYQCTGKYSDMVIPQVNYNSTKLFECIHFVYMYSMW